MIDWHYLSLPSPKLDTRKHNAKLHENESKNSGSSEDEDSTTHRPAKKNKTATILSDDKAALAQDLNYEVDIEDYTGS